MDLLQQRCWGTNCIFQNNYERGIMPSTAFDPQHNQSKVSTDAQQMAMELQYDIVISIHWKFNNLRSRKLIKFPLNYFL